MAGKDHEEADTRRKQRVPARRLTLWIIILAVLSLALFVYIQMVERSGV